MLKMMTSSTSLDFSVTALAGNKTVYSEPRSSSSRLFIGSSPTRPRYLSRERLTSSDMGRPVSRDNRCSSLCCFSVIVQLTLRIFIDYNPLSGRFQRIAQVRKMGYHLLELVKHFKFIYHEENTGIYKEYVHKWITRHPPRGIYVLYFMAYLPDVPKVYRGRIGVW